MAKHANGKTATAKEMVTNRTSGGSYIPVHLISNGNGSAGRPLKENRHASMSAIERQMEAEVEKALENPKPWESNSKFKGFKTDSFHLRSSESGSGLHHDSGRRRRRVNSTPLSKTTPISIPEIDIIRRENTSMNTSTESLNDDDKRPLYVRCPETGKKRLRIEFDVQGYSEENITVRVSNSKLTVHAIQNETEDGRQTTNEFCRKVKLPSDVICDQIMCCVLDGKLIVESPVKTHFVSPSQSESLAMPLSDISSSSLDLTEPINEPFIRTSQDAPGNKTLHLNVQVGNVFQADDVTVKVKGQDKVCISAEREEQTSKSKLSAKLAREFDLPSKIIPQSISAGLTVGGLLKISAHVDHAQPVTVVLAQSDDVRCMSFQK